MGVFVGVQWQCTLMCYGMMAEGSPTFLPSELPIWTLTWVAVSIAVACQVGTTYYLFDDMRLQCYTTEWTAYAIYAIVMIAVYVVGLPALILFLVFKNRATLFGPKSSRTMRQYGFLYDSYGESAWFWEVEELLRKLFLTAMPVLFDTNNPIQVCDTVVGALFVHGREWLRRLG